jgi:glycosyltransferase involved in cell wall biosynthesis
MDRFSLHDRVHFVGQVADVRGAHEQADIFVLSSLYEGFPNALCEAMASGLPCISTDSPSGPSEIIENGENGILIANADEAGLVEAIELLIDDGALRQKLGRNAEKLVERYSEDRIMGLWDSCIQSVRSET